MPHRGFRLFDIAGFNIRIDATWFFIVTLMVWSLYRQVFPDIAPGFSSTTYLAMAVTTMLLFFISLVAHELAHSLMARRVGLKVGGITLFIFGGIAELTDDPHDARSEFWIAIAGPCASLLVAFAFSMAAQMLSAFDGAQPLQVVLAHLSMLNVTMMVFNMVPAYPLDGGRVLRAALWHFTGDRFRATMIAASAGIAFAVFLILVGLSVVFGANDFSAFWLVLVGTFLLMLAQSTRSEALLRRHLGGRTVASIMTTNAMTTVPETLLQDLVDRQIIDHGLSFLPVVAQGLFVGVVDAAAVRRVDHALWTKLTVRQVMEAPSPSNTVAPDAASDAVLHIMAKTGRRKLVVARDGMVVGVVTLADLLNYIGLMQMFSTGITDLNTSPVVGGGNVLSNSLHARMMAFPPRR